MRARDIKWECSFSFDRISELKITEKRPKRCIQSTKCSKHSIWSATETNWISPRELCSESWCLIKTVVCTALHIPYHATVHYCCWHRCRREKQREFQSRFWLKRKMRISTISVPNPYLHISHRLILWFRINSIMEIHYSDLTLGSFETSVNFMLENTFKGFN